MITQHLLAGLFLGFEPITSHPHQAAMFITHIHGANHAAQVGSEEPQDFVTQHGQGQLTQHLLGQLGLAVTQPGLMLQSLCSALLGLQVLGVAVGQGQQVSASEVGEQCAEPDQQHNERDDARDGDSADRLVTGHAQLLLGADQVLEFLADFVGQAFATAVTDQFSVSPFGAAQVDHLAAEVVPRALQRDQPIDALDLLGIVLDHASQALQAVEDPGLGHLVRV